MRLILTLAAGGSAIAENDKIRTLSSGSISIGRAPGNGWVLPDPERSLSKTHCTITEEGGRFVLTDLSTNGIFINGSQQATERDSRVVLNDGDTLRLGNYTISAAAIDDRTAAFAPQDDIGLTADGFAGGGSGGAGSGGAGRGLGQPGAILPAGSGFNRTGPLDVDPLDDPLGRVPDASFHHPVAAVPVPPQMPDPFDRGEPSRHRSIELDADLFRGSQPNTEWPGASRPDNAAAISQAMPAMRVTHSIPPGEIDFDALIGDLGNHAAPVRPVPPPAAPVPHPMVPPPIAVPDPFFEPPRPRPSEATQPQLSPLDLPSVPGAAVWTGAAEPSPAPVSPSLTSPPRAEAAADVQPPPPAAAAAPSREVVPGPAGRDGDARAALMAFLDGAGVADARIDDSDPVAALRAAGSVFRALTEGVREVLISRASIKSEMRIEQTMIASHGNNPLKFSVTADDAVGALLTSKRPGYMAPLAATQEALSDIKSHEIAVMVGVQTALLALLRRFDPDELEKRLTTSGLASVLPGARKSRYWDGFRQTYGDITREAEDDFQAVFGRPFAKAYAAQSRKE
jgi:type VI secretion system protein